MANALDVAHLSVSFGRRSVLDDVSFSVAAGSALAVIGPNASGKTVLFRALIGAVPSHGEIRWAPGTRIGYVPQKLDVERDLPLTGIDLLHAKADVTHAASDDVARAIERVGLTAAVARQTIGTLSGGQFQRLLVAFALISRPTMLLIDEPTSGVDEPGEESIHTLFEQLRREGGLTVLLISHELNIVYRYTDEVLCLSRGRASFYGTPVDVLTPEHLREVYGAPMRFRVPDGHDV